MPATSMSHHARSEQQRESEGVGRRDTAQKETRSIQTRRKRTTGCIETTLSATTPGAGGGAGPIADPDSNQLDRVWARCRSSGYNSPCETLQLYQR
jgi:hypothetical protein